MKKRKAIYWKVGLILRMLCSSFHSLARKYVLQMLTLVSVSSFFVDVLVGMNFPGGPTISILEKGEVIR